MSAANTDARSHNITLMTVKDLVNLVLVASTQRLAFPELRDLFETCRTPGEARAWIEKARTRPGGMACPGDSAGNLGFTA